MIKKNNNDNNNNRVSTLKNVSLPNIKRDSLIDFKYVIHNTR